LSRRLRVLGPEFFIPEPRVIADVRENLFHYGGRWKINLKFRTFLISAQLGRPSATNQNLEQMVAERRFRMDLYYRLNVFPILLPPLRERTSDIPLLIDHFLRKIGGRYGKSIDRVSHEVMAATMRYDWPGNIRELQNFIERSVILTNGRELRAPIAELTNHETRDGVVRTLDDAHRALIIKILRETNWVVGGPNGAAAKLGLKRPTLVTKMRRLGISTGPAKPVRGASVYDWDPSPESLAVPASI
jgi:DNA-binding NtrC family response regulator